jgi:hypothetical protein
VVVGFCREGEGKGLSDEFCGLGERCEDSTFRFSFNLEISLAPCSMGSSTPNPTLSPMIKELVLSEFLRERSDEQRGPGLYVRIMAAVDGGRVLSRRERP